MKISICILTLIVACLPGCSVFRQTAVDKNVEVSRDLTLQGLAADYEKNVQQAESLFSSAVHSDPDNVEARMLLAKSYRNRGQIKSAIEQLEESLEIAPDNVELICQLGECYSVSNQVDHALKLSQLALRKDKENVQGWTLKAQTLWRKGNRDAALADYQRALRIEPGNQELRRQMAVLYQELNKPLRALTTLDKIANEFDEEKVPEEILVRQSVALQNLNRNPEAIDRLQVGFKRGDYSEKLAESYVAALMREQRIEKADSVLRLASIRFPQDSRLAQLKTQLASLESGRLADSNPNR